MTIDEAISIMNVIVHMIEPQYDTDRIEDAVEMAIKALNQEPCDDAVSRQAVLEILNDAYFLKLDDGAALQESVNQLPSVTAQPCDDAISRQAVLDLPRIKTHNVWGNVIYESVDVESVKQLPSVTPQPMMGQWKRISMDMYVQHAMAYYECSECGKKMIGTHNYCPNCGAKMSEIPTGEEGSDKE